MDNIRYVLIYFVIVNLTSFITFYLDKQKARKDMWRIQEKTLHTFSFLGGSIGSIAAMKVFRHKTQKKGFVIITLLALLLNIYFYYKLLTYIGY